MENAAPRKWWEPFTPQDGMWYRWLLLGAEILVCRRENRWSGLCKDRPWKERTGTCSGPGEAGMNDPPGDIFWGNSSKYPSAAIRPLLPAKPFLISFPRGLRLFPETELTLELNLPFLLRLSIVKNHRAEETIFSFEPFILNETWYGDTTMEGLLCLALNMDGIFEEPAETPGEKAPQTGAIRCRMLLRNRVKTAVKLSAIPLFAGEFSIYEKDQELVSDTPVVDIFGTGDFRMSPAAPDHARVLVPGNKSGVGEMLIHHGTRIIKDITGH
ncbi:MAG: hypothetical protein LBO65_05480 [Spirochaetaceae bacterium]|jgi:hypothetical protein|nr:hypothetical protein [Spirochaetaceae bacterium]